MFDTDFLTHRHGSYEAYERAIRIAQTTLLRAMPTTACSGSTAAVLAERLSTEICPARGLGLEAAVARAADVVAQSINVGHPAVAAHLHCPPLITALAAEVVLTALNQSMDSFDQAPAATVIEQHLTEWLCREVGLPAGAGGTFTAGGTQSNFMGLLLARDAFLAQRGWIVREHGLPPDHDRLAIVCSDLAHFTIEKSAIQLGLGARAVVTVATDASFRMDARALRATVDRLETEGRQVVAIVATAGTTDFGSIDPLGEAAETADACGAWLHVDGAYGGALLLSPTRRETLKGLERADSIAMDAHKLLWQSISCGMLLVRDAAQFELLATHADYLNPQEHEAQGIPDLVNRSVLTTRRFDALKLWISLQAHGREGLSAMIDATCELARLAAEHIDAHPSLELVNRWPAISCVVFRYRPAEGAPADSAACAHRSDARDAVARIDEVDHVNTRIRASLFDAGEAVIGVTRVAGRVCLKLTLLNPTTRPGEVRALIDRIVAAGDVITHRGARPTCATTAR